MRQAAVSFDVLNAMYGIKADITEHYAVHVLREMAAQADAQRLEDWVNHYASRTK